MISQGVVKKLAIKLQTTELNIRREYIQHLFLSHLYKETSTDKILFKGGTALRIIYGSPRFSEDLDFSSTIKGKKQIENIVLSTLEAIEREGVETEIKESKETSGGYLSIIDSNIHGEIIGIQLEISQRRKLQLGEVVTIANDFIPSYTIVRLSQQQLISEKILALRVRKKPRDYYDLYYILRAGLLTSSERTVLNEIIKTIPSVDINFELELKRFLPQSHWPIIRDFKNNFVREMRRFI